MADEKPFHLRGNYAPVSEEITAFDLPVQGALPPELRGLYVRNGANPVTGTSPHWFLGQGMLHGVRLEAGRALWYRNRYVRTPYFENPGIQRVSSDGKFDRIASAANTHVLAHAGKLLALEEGSFPWVVDGELGTVGYDDYRGKLTTAMTAHPKLCPVTGELHGFGYGQLPPFLVYHRISPDGQLRPERRDRGRRPDDDPRLRHHDAARAVHGSAGGLRSRAGAPGQHAVPLER